MTRSIRTAKHEAAFLEALGEYGNVTSACRAARIGRTAAYDWSRTDPAFAAAWHAA